MRSSLAVLNRRGSQRLLECSAEIIGRGITYPRCDVFEHQALADQFDCMVNPGLCQVFVEGQSKFLLHQPAQVGRRDADFICHLYQVQLEFPYIAEKMKDLNREEGSFASIVPAL